MDESALPVPRARDADVRTARHVRSGRAAAQCQCPDQSPRRRPRRRLTSGWPALRRRVDSAVLWPRPGAAEFSILSPRPRVKPSGLPHRGGGGGRSRVPTSRPSTLPSSSQRRSATASRAAGRAARTRRPRPASIGPPWRSRLRRRARRQPAVVAGVDGAEVALGPRRAARSARSPPAGTGRRGSARRSPRGGGRRRGGRRAGRRPARAGGPTSCSSAAATSASAAPAGSRPARRSAARGRAGSASSS